MEPTIVGIREFRARLAEFLLRGNSPVTVTRHGATVGYFIPARASQRDLNRATLIEAAAQMDAMLRDSHFTDREITDISREFRASRTKKGK